MQNSRHDWPDFKGKILQNRHLRVRGPGIISAVFKRKETSNGQEHCHRPCCRCFPRRHCRSRFRRPGAFDAAISLFTSFGYFHDDEEEGAVLRNLCDSLKPGGRLLIDVMGKEIVARGFKQSMVQRRMLPEGEAMLIDEPRVGDDWHHIASTWTFLWPNGSRQEFELKCRVYSAVELKRLLAEAAFAEVRVFGGLDGSIYDQNARRLVAVARRNG